MKDDLQDKRFPSFAQLIDPLDFGTVKRSFRNPNSGITQVILVSESYSLAEAAARFAVRSPSRDTTAELLDLLKTGAIRVGVDDMNQVSPPVAEFAVLLDTIEDDVLCFVIHRPPVYFAKITDRTFE